MPPRNAAKDSAKNAAKNRRPPGGRKPTAAEVQRRMAFVEEVLSRACSREAIVAECWREFRMPPRTVDDYIARVRKEWQEAAKATRPERRQEARSRLLVLRPKLEADKAWSALISAERLLAEIDGVRAPEQIVVSPPQVEDLITSVEDAIREALLGLEAAARYVVKKGSREQRESVENVCKAAIKQIRSAAPVRT